jgi:hypothetical protein
MIFTLVFVTPTQWKLASLRVGPRREVFARGTRTSRPGLQRTDGVGSLERRPVQLLRRAVPGAPFTRAAPPFQGRPW